MLSRAQVLDICAEEDVPQLEAELEGMEPEEQWKLLPEVREYLLSSGVSKKLAASDEHAALGEFAAVDSREAAPLAGVQLEAASIGIRLIMSSSDKSID